MTRGWRSVAGRVVAVAAGALMWAACAQNPGTASETLGQSIIELGDAIAALREDNAAIQEQLDSLRRQVARQDTVMRQLANLAGMPVPTP